MEHMCWRPPTIPEFNMHHTLNQDSAQLCFYRRVASHCMVKTQMAGFCLKMSIIILLVSSLPNFISLKRTSHLSLYTSYQRGTMFKKKTQSGKVWTERWNLQHVCQRRNTKLIATVRNINLFKVSMKAEFTQFI